MTQQSMTETTAGATTGVTASGADAGRRVESFVEGVRGIRAALHEVVVGQDRTIDLLLTCALTGSHALLVGVPGWPRR
jgi:MoxR-like ATPase